MKLTKLPLYLLLTVLTLSCSKDDNDIKEDKQDGTVNVDLNSCQQKYNLYVDGRELEYDYNLRVKMEEMVYEMGSFLYKIKYSKTSTTNVFTESTDYEYYDDTDEIEKMQLMAITNFIKRQSFVTECNGTVYTSLNQDMSNSQVTYILDLKLNESYTHEGITTNGFNATSTFKLIKENVSFKTAGKTFTCNVYEQLTKSSDPNALDVVGELWFDKNYGLVQADLSTVKMVLTKINK